MTMLSGPGGSKLSDDRDRDGVPLEALLGDGFSSAAFPFGSFRERGMVMCGPTSSTGDRKREVSSGDKDG